MRQETILLGLLLFLMHSFSSEASAYVVCPPESPTQSQPETYICTESDQDSTKGYGWSISPTTAANFEPFGSLDYDYYRKLQCASFDPLPVQDMDGNVIGYETHTKSGLVTVVVQIGAYTG